MTATPWADIKRAAAVDTWPDRKHAAHYARGGLGRESRRDYFGTATSAPVYLLAPERSVVRLVDVAIALSRISRFNGHTSLKVAGYSVADHAVLVSKLCPPALALHGWGHDNHEAYVGDVVSPLKRCLGDVFGQLDERWDARCSAEFGIVWTPHVRAAVKVADELAFVVECWDLLEPTARVRAIGQTPRPEGVPRIVPLSADAACAAFLRRYWEVTP